MKYLPAFLRNKFILTFVVFCAYSLFLDENDIFTMISNTNKLSQLETKKVDLNQELSTTTATLKKLKSRSEIEKFAREKKFFKMDDEDVFVIYNKSIDN